jgi:glycerophosphoryl diester phosphodiesterase
MKQKTQIKKKGLLPKKSSIPHKETLSITSKELPSEGMRHNTFWSVIKSFIKRYLSSFPYWWSGIVVYSVILFFCKAYFLVQLGIADGNSRRETTKWHLARWWNDMLFCFLVRIIAAAAMRSSRLWLKSMCVLLAWCLLYLYTVDIFTIRHLNSRYMMSEIWFVSLENVWPYLRDSILWTVLRLAWLFASVSITRWLSLFISNAFIFRLIRWGLVLCFIVFGVSLLVPITSPYQPNLIQIQAWWQSREKKIGDKPYEAYFKSFPWKNQRPDIIVVFAESFSSIDSQLAWGSRNLFPWFDTIARDGTFYTNFVANGCTSDAAHIAVLQWIQARTTPNMQQDYTRYKSYTLWLPAFLWKHWYNSTFISTASLGFLNQKDFLTSLQFDNIIGSEAFTSWPKYVFRAAPDQALYEKAESILVQPSNKPRFVVLQTISSHKPYNSPAGWDEEWAFTYSDTQLLQFYRSLQATHYFDHGILIVVGDHRKMQAMWYDEIEKRWKNAYGKALFAIVGKWIPAWKVNTSPVQHRDIFSSLKRLAWSGSIMLDQYYNDVFGWYQWRDIAIRYCQFVDKQYVASNAEGASWTIHTQQKNDPMAGYIRSHYQFQQGGDDRIAMNTGSVLTGWQVNYPGLVLVAHQGLATTAPPGSLDAYIAAEKVGSQGIEMDVSFTKDGYPVVMHGPDIGRTKCVNSIGKKLVSDFNLQEMKDNCKLYNDQVILTLQEVLEKTEEMFRRYFVDIKINFDDQKAFVAPMLQSIKKLWLQKNIMFSSTDTDVNFQLGSTSDIIAWWEVFSAKDIPAVMDANHSFVLLPYNIITPEIVDQILRSKKNLIAYTVNDPMVMRRLYDRGVRFFLTDKPDTLAK